MSDQIHAFTLTPSEILPMIDHVTSRRDSEGNPKPMLAPFIWGAPGIGKTELVRTIADVRGSRIVALHLPQFDPTDIKGIPVRSDDGRVDWVPSSYLPQHRKFHPKKFAELLDQYESEFGSNSIQVDFPYAVDIAVYLFDENGNEIGRWNDPMLDDLDEVETGGISVSSNGNDWTITFGNKPSVECELHIVDKAVIFLDELSAADPSTQTAALQLVLDRRVGEYDVPHGVSVIAAGNREEDGAFVQTLSHPLCNRFAHLTLVPDVEDFIEWGIANKVRPEIIGMMKWDPSALFDYDPKALVNGQYGFATPRSWKFLSDQYAELDYFLNLAGGDRNDRQTHRRAERLRHSLFSGIVGQGRASQFIGYLQAMHDMPHPDEIAAGNASDIGDVERSKSFGLLYALIYKLQHVYEQNYNPDLPAKDQGPEWTEPRDNIIDFITNNFEEEAGTWAWSVLSEQGNIQFVAFRGDAFLKFSKKYLRVYSQIGGRRK